ncbi:hypothetical protein IFO70_18945 [Phormidium tenue FACHB-886]|nr:hypothetical protein [Phormidium tenue FACHB-886]
MQAVRCLTHIVTEGQAYQDACAEQAYQALKLDSCGSGRSIDELDRATAELLSELELQAQAATLQTFHFYVTVEHPDKGEQGFYLDTTRERFADVMSAITARRQELKLFGYKLIEAIDLGTLPF